MRHGHPERHALVIAPQCTSMGRLVRLEKAAAALGAVLTDPSVGDCRPGLPDGTTTLLTGDHLTSAEITAAAERAIQYAAERGAVLVLAFLGHGLTPGGSGTLHLMAADSHDDLRHRSVKVTDLLTTALDHPAIPGVLGIVDTCHAAGALPAAQDLTSGTTLGNTRIALLMGASLHEEAVDLAFSRGLTALLRSGIPGRGPTLTTADLRSALRATLTGQSVTGLDYDGTAGEPLWFARNTRAGEPLPGGLGGPLAHEELTEALAALDPPPPLPDTGVPAAERCRDEVLTRPAGPARERALRALDSLLLALRTVIFIRSWTGAGLTTEALRHALHTLLAAEQRVPAPGTAVTDVAIVDELAFNHPASEPDGRAALARFTALLGLHCGKRPDDPELLGWGRLIQAPAQVNDAIRYATARGDEQRLGLVVSLHSSLAGEWPETLDAWLLLDGSVLHHEQFPAEPADRPGAEAALEAAALWAEDLARTLRLPLKRLDIAVPGALLLEWRPEEAGTALLLGVRFDVRLHWSSRLTPDAVLRSVDTTVAERWETISGAASGAPVDWLAHEDLADRQLLRGRLRTGRYTRGIGLTQHPGGDPRLLEILLAYTPVLLWPRTDLGFPEERHGCLDTRWWAMPGALLHAYRESWRGADAGDLAELRAVWDDREWLRFCWYFRSTPTGGAPAADEGGA
ncbi:vWA-MoxR associated conflict system protein [Streptomyces sp. NPDC001889]